MPWNGGGTKDLPVHDPRHWASDGGPGAPRVLRHEVLIEAQNLASVTLQECLRDGGGDPECHSASAALIGEIHAAMVALCDDPSIRSFGHDPADHMRS